MTIEAIYDAYWEENDPVGVVSYLYIILNILSLWNIIATIKKMESIDIDK